MHVAQLSFFSDPSGRRPEELLKAWPSLGDVAECATAANLEVSVIQASTHLQEMCRNNVHYYFLPFGNATPARRLSSDLTVLLDELQPEVIHVHGLGFPRDVVALARISRGVPIVLQDHADSVPRLWHRPSWKRGFDVSAGVAFCSRAQARPFHSAGLLGPRTRVYEIPESTSRFMPGDRERARRELDIGGDPLVVWVGHLNGNKDPLTVLDGISKAARTLHGLKLYCCYGSAPLLQAVQRRVARDPVLHNRVQLMGRLPHARIERLMQAADLYVLGSHREGSGYSLLEALACGVVPVVTDIPSFRSLTASGAVGALWPVGDSDALCSALLRVARQLSPLSRRITRAHFDRKLSFDAVGVKLKQMYEDVQQ